MVMGIREKISLIIIRPFIFVRIEFENDLFQTFDFACEFDGVFSNNGISIQVNSYVGNNFSLVSRPYLHKCMRYQNQTEFIC